MLWSFPGYSWTSKGLLQIRTGKTFHLIDVSEKKVVDSVELPDNAENAVFSEAGRFAACTVNDDLFVSSSGKTVRITTDGGNGIVNGKTVHRNEFGIKNGIFISPGGNFIAFYRKDESMVSDYPLVDYLPRVAQPKPFKYPMAGMTNEQVTLGVYDIASEKTTFLKTGGNPEHYLTNPAWSPDERQIYVAELNRGQNHMHLNCYSINSGEKIKTVLEEVHEKYVEPQYPVRFSGENKNEFYLLSRNDGWFHVYKYNADGKLIRQITKKWEVTKLLGFDEKYLLWKRQRRVRWRAYLPGGDKTGKMEKLTEIAGLHQGLLSPGGG